nr:hypothetical protein CFP56_72222 [Quercus suber]
MEAGSSSQFPDKPERVKGASISSRLGSMFPKRGFDHRNGGGSSPKIEIDPILGRTRPNQGIEIEPRTRVPPS